MDLIRGDETPAEIAALAIGMEESLKQFYQTLLAQAQDNDVKQLFSKMIEVSELHKQKFVQFYQQLEPGKDVAQLEADVKTEVMEGGFKMNDFIQKNGPSYADFDGCSGHCHDAGNPGPGSIRPVCGEGRSSCHERISTCRWPRKRRRHLNMLGQLLEEKVKAKAV